MRPVVLRLEVAEDLVAHVGGHVVAELGQQVAELLQEHLGVTRLAQDGPQPPEFGAQRAGAVGVEQAGEGLQQAAQPSRGDARLVHVVGLVSADARLHRLQHADLTGGPGEQHVAGGFVGVRGRHQPRDGGEGPGHLRGVRGRLGAALHESVGEPVEELGGGVRFELDLDLGPRLVADPSGGPYGVAGEGGDGPVIDAEHGFDPGRAQSGDRNDGREPGDLAHLLAERGGHGLGVGGPHLGAPLPRGRALEVPAVVTTTGAPTQRPAGVGQGAGEGVVVGRVQIEGAGGADVDDASQVGGEAGGCGELAFDLEGAVRHR